MLDYTYQDLSAQAQQHLGRPLSKRAYHLLLQRMAPVLAQGHLTRFQTLLSKVWERIPDSPVEGAPVTASDIEAAFRSMGPDDDLDLSSFEIMGVVLDGKKEPLLLSSDTWAGVLLGALPYPERVQLLLSFGPREEIVPISDSLPELSPYLSGSSKRYSARVVGQTQRVTFDSPDFLRGLNTVQEWLRLPSALYSDVKEGETPMQAHNNFHDLFLYHHSESPTSPAGNTVFHNCTLLRDMGDMSKGDTFDAIEITVELYMWKDDEMVGDEVVAL